MTHKECFLFLLFSDDFYCIVIALVRNCFDRDHPQSKWRKDEINIFIKKEEINESINDYEKKNK